MTPTVRRTAMVGSAGLLAVGLLLGGAALGNPGDAIEQPASSSSAAPDPGSLEALQARLERVPGDYPGWATLGLLYVDRARTTLDPSWYAKAQEALDRSLEIQPEDNAHALTGLATLQAAQHEFAAAEQTARQALVVNGFDAAAYGVLTDALVELGRYDEAVEVLQSMADVDPGYTALTRISYARELRGDIPGARAALEQALDASSTGPDAGFVLHLLGELAWGYDGDVEAARALWERGLQRDPESLSLQAALGRAATAQGRPEEALAAYEDVTRQVPVQQYLIEHAELLRSLGREQEAVDQLELVSTANALLEDGGSVIDLEAALFEADHGSPERALADARAAHDKRPDNIFTADALAWALYASGRYEEALPYADQALSLGMRRASFLYHRGMIADALGRTEEAQRFLQEALDTNPHFSIPQAAAARAVLAR